LFQRCFSRDARVLLLVKVPKTDVGTAMFFLGEQGRLSIDRATVEFPFNLRELGAEESPAATAAPVVAAAARPARGGLAWKLGAVGVALIASLAGLSGVFDSKKTQKRHPVVVEQPAVVEPPPAVEIPVTALETETPKPVPAPVKAATPPRVGALPRKSEPVTTRTEHIASSAGNATVKPDAALQPALAPAPQRATPPPALVPQPGAVTPPPAALPASPVQATMPVEPTELSIAPRATRQFAPIVPDSVRRSITGDVVVKVRVKVDASGKVTAVEALSTGNAVAESLAGAAIGALKKWQFEPARRGEQKVAGEVVLSFTFRK